MRILAVLIAGAVLAPGCGAPAREASARAAPPAGASGGDDCAVIAAIAKEHYGFGAQNPPPPLWLDAEGSDWAPRCDWARLGVSFPSTFDPDAGQQPGRRAWVSFKRPRYDGQGALVETGIMHGPRSGSGGTCRVRSGFAGWTVASCEDTWIS